MHEWYARPPIDRAETAFKRPYFSRAFSFRARSFFRHRALRVLVERSGESAFDASPPSALSRPTRFFYFHAGDRSVVCSSNASRVDLEAGGLKAFKIFGKDGSFHFRDGVSSNAGLLIDRLTKFYLFLK